MHPSRQQTEDYIRRARTHLPRRLAAKRQSYLEALGAFLDSLEYHDGYAIGQLLGAAVLVPASRTERLLPLGERLAAWVLARPDLYPGGEVQKVILLAPGASRSEYFGELDRLGAFDVGTMPETFRRLFEGSEAAQRYARLARPQFPQKA